MELVILSKGFKTIIDKEDYKFVNSFKWYACQKDNRYYASRTVRYGNRKDNKKHHLFLHRILLNAPEGIFVDHINGNSLDNRKNNLRLCSNKENSRNRKIKNKYKGIKKNLNCKTWSARITVDQIELYLGCFKNDIDAAMAYNEAAIKYFGKFAKLNDVK